MMCSLDEREDVQDADAWELGQIAGPGGRLGTVALSRPLVISDAEIDESLLALDGALAEAAAAA